MLDDGWTVSSESVISNTPQKKKCGKCKRWLAPQLFYKSKQAKDGLQFNCKACQKAYNTRRNRRNKFLKKALPLEDRVAWINELHTKRAKQETTDITTLWLMSLWQTAKFCPLCRASFVSRGKKQRNLDHIVPISEGGKHQQDNVRIICRTCNLTRPKDGSDIPRIEIAAEPTKTASTQSAEQIVEVEVAAAE